MINMNIFITGTNTDIGKTYVTKYLYKALKTRGYRVCIFKPFQTEEIGGGRYPDLEIYKNECDLDYDVTSLYTFKDPVSPHLAFKIERHKQLNHQTMIDKLESLEAQFDMILIEGAGGIAVPIYEYSDHFYMTTDLIKDTSDFIVSVLPSKLGAINDAIVHQKYIDHHELPPNVLIMNNYTDSAIEQDNLHTIEKLTHKPVYTLDHQATQESFSETFIQRMIGGSNG